MTQQCRQLTITDGQLIEGDGSPNVGGGNDELQYYKKENVEFTDLTTIKIQMKEELCFNDNNRGYSFSSGRLHSKIDVDLSTPGKIEALISMPDLPGVWPAFGLLPTDPNLVWPSGGEIDIMEARGRLPYEYYGSVHYLGEDNKHICESVYKKFSEFNSITNFHLYSLEGNDTELLWYVDNLKVWAVKKADLASKINFKNKFCIIINLAAGGSFDNYLRPDPKQLPRSMIIKDVKYGRA